MSDLHPETETDPGRETSPAAAADSTAVDSTADARAPRSGLGLEARLAFAAVVIFVLAVFLVPTPEDEVAPLGDLETADGGSVSMESQMAPVTLVHFWSTWCPPCITETPAIERLAADLASESEFDLLMVAVADEKEKVAEFLGSAEDTLYDPDWKIAHSYGTKKLPETHLVVDGRIVESFAGAVSWDDPEVRQRIADALASVRQSRS